jgi:hypothetical protein
MHASGQSSKQKHSKFKQIANNGSVIALSRR